jgi:hypothetical protein
VKQCQSLLANKEQKYQQTPMLRVLTGNVWAKHCHQKDDAWHCSYEIKNDGILITRNSFTDYDSKWSQKALIEMIF